MGSKLLQLQVNGEAHTVAVLEHHTLLEVLREDLHLTGTKHGCEMGECGACTVLVDGIPKLSCLILPQQVVGKEIQTIEGVAAGSTLHPLQRAFSENCAAQCGYCTPGMILTAKHLLEQNLDPSDEAIKEALSGNLCRCTGYTKIIEAVKMAARDMRLEVARKRETAATR